MAQQVGKVITDPAVNQARLYDASDTWVATSILVTSGNGGLKTITFLDVALGEYRMDLHDSAGYVASLSVVKVEATTWSVPVDASAASILTEIRKVPRASQEMDAGTGFKVQEGANETVQLTIAKSP